MGSTVFESVNPATGEVQERLPAMTDGQLEKALNHASLQAARWAQIPVGQRVALLKRVADRLERERDELAALITAEMGKLVGEARAEIDKCASVCRYYAEHASGFLADQTIPSDAGRSLVAHQPLGLVLAVMPWNFPFWQVFRFAAPALAAGNAALLKHAANVPRCAAAIEAVFSHAGAPRGLFTNLAISSDRVAAVIDDPRVKAVTLTGSEPAGRAVAARAGRALKKTVLELGGSDPFVVLEDAALDMTVAKAVQSRFMNAGQSCIAAKRFILAEAVADAFIARFVARVAELRPGDPADPHTDLAPMARADLREELHAQVEDALAKGAELHTGGQPLDGPGYFYAPTVLSGVTPAMRAYREELFGPVAVIHRVSDEAAALRLANDTDFGLGGSVWTENRARGLAFARRLECGCAFVNELVKSDPRLPFGGVKNSGYGRELSALGMCEFVNSKTIWVD